MITIRPKSPERLQFILAVGLAIFSTLVRGADCGSHFDSADKEVKKASFHYAKGFQLNQRIAAQFPEEEKFIAASHNTYKLYNYELAIYNYSESVKAYEAAVKNYFSLTEDSSCSTELKEKSTPLLQAARLELAEAKKNFHYFECQYAIDQAQAALTISIDYKTQQNFIKAQEQADGVRKLTVDGASEKSACSANQITYMQALYKQAWDILTETNRPLEQQFYCQNQLNSIALKFKDADVELSRNARPKAIHQWQMAEKQIGKVLDTKACPPDSIHWLDEKLAWVQKEIKGTR